MNSARPTLVDTSPFAGMREFVCDGRAFRCERARAGLWLVYLQRSGSYVYDVSVVCESGTCDDLFRAWSDAQ